MNDTPPRDFPSLIRDVPDFPKPGIRFKDITPLLADPAGFDWVVETMAGPWRERGVACVAGIEARGFILGAALARALGAGFVPVRKPGKLPARVIAQDYALEYGSDRLEIHADAVIPGTRVLLVDDVLATGGTLLAARALLERAGASLVGAAVLVELTALEGRARWDGGTALEASLRY